MSPNPNQSQTQKEIEYIVNTLSDGGVIEKDKITLQIMEEIFKHIPGHLITQLFKIYTEDKLIELEQKLKNT